MTISTEKLKEKKLRRWLDALSLGAVLQYMVFRFLQSTMFIIYYSQIYKMITMGLLVTLGGVRYIRILHLQMKELINKKEKYLFIFRIVISWTLAMPFFYVGWKNDYKILFFFPVCCMCLYQMDASFVIKRFAICLGILLAATVLCVLAGTVSNIGTLTERGFVGSYGIINSSDFATYIVFLMAYSWCAIEKENWRSRVFYLILLIGVGYAVWVYTNSRTALLCLILLALLVIWHEFNSKRFARTGKLLKFLSAFAFPMVGVFVVILVTLYSNNNTIAIQIDEILTERLKVTWMPFEKYGIKPFGNIIKGMHGSGGTTLGYKWSTGYGYIDVAYAMLAIRYGWVITVIFAGFWIWLTVRALRSGQDKYAFVLALMAVHGFSEARILDLNYNIFLALPFCCFNKNTHNQVETRNKDSLHIRICKSMFIILVCTIVLLFPSILAELRSFFFLLDWNSGTNAVYSFIFVALLGLLWYLIGKIIFSMSIYNRRAVAAIIVGCLVLGGTKITINKTISEGINRNCNWLEKEASVIKIAQESSTMPVYAAELDGIYAWTIGGFSNHIFPMEELCNGRKGTMFVDQRTEIEEIMLNGGKYAQISEHTGIYSFDEAVIAALSNAGYTWTSYYRGIRKVNLADTAIFNEIDLSRPVEGPARVITRNSETDQHYGAYNVSFKLKSLPQKAEELICEVEILGCAGESILYKRPLYAEDFDTNGSCLYEFLYSHEGVPKVSFGVEIPDGRAVYIDEISWYRAY